MANAHSDGRQPWSTTSTSRSTSRPRLSRRSPHRVDASPGVVVHYSPPLHPDDVAVVDGIPCTSVARTLVDCVEWRPYSRCSTKLLTSSPRRGDAPFPAPSCREKLASKSKADPSRDAARKRWTARLPRRPGPLILPAGVRDRRPPVSLGLAAYAYVQPLSPGDRDPETNARAKDEAAWRPACSGVQPAARDVRPPVSGAVWQRVGRIGGSLRPGASVRRAESGRRRPCASPAEWPWSSHRYMLGDCRETSAARARIETLLEAWGGRDGFRYPRLFDPENELSTILGAASPWAHRPPIEGLRRPAPPIKGCASHGRTGTGSRRSRPRWASTRPPSRENFGAPECRKGVRPRAGKGSVPLVLSGALTKPSLCRTLPRVLLGVRARERVVDLQLLFRRRVDAQPAVDVHVNQARRYRNERACQPARPLVGPQLGCGPAVQSSSTGFSTSSRSSARACR